MESKSLIRIIRISDLNLIRCFRVMPISHVIWQPKIEPFVDPIVVRCVIKTLPMSRYHSQIFHHECIQCGNSLQMNWIIKIVRPETIINPHFH